MTTKAGLGRSIVKWMAAVAVIAALAGLLVRFSGSSDRWRRSERKLGDVSQVAFSLDADTLAVGWVRNSKPTLVVSCSGPRRIEFFVLTRLPAAVEKGDHRTVRLQFDAEAATIAAWSQSENRQLLIAPPDQAMGLADQVAKAQRLRFAFLPFHADPTTVVFSVAGFDAHWRALRAACGLS